MTDLRTMLHDAAPTPRRAIDVDAVIVAAARRRPWKRIGLWFASVAAVAGLGVGATGVLAPASSPTEVDTAPAPRREVRVPISDVQDEVAFEVVSTTDDSTTTTTIEPAAASDDGSPSASEWPPPKDARASQEGCHVAAGGTGVLTPVGAAGNDDVDADRCGYVAREQGGYRGTGTWTVTIERDGEKTTYSHYLDSPPCADDVIRPGDVVTVTVRTAGATAEGEAHAGPDVGCG